jgi:kynurenine formamidase
MDFEGTFVDLSQEIYTGMPVYPGHLKTVIFTHASHDEVKRAIGTGFSYQTSGILMCDHGPTHIDPVSHFSRDPDAPSVDEIPLEHCVTSAICLDVSDVPRESQFGADKIEAELLRWNLEIRPGDTVLFYTGHYERFYGTPEYATHQPGLTREATEYIIDRGAINFGVDSTISTSWSASGSHSLRCPCASGKGPGHRFDRSPSCLDSRSPAELAHAVGEPITRARTPW